MEKTILHLCAKNDHNGNPQRCYVLNDDSGNFIAAWDEGYRGSDAVPGEFREEAYLSQRFDVSVKKYKETLRKVPSFAYAWDVHGYSHLRPIG